MNKKKFLGLLVFFLGFGMCATSCKSKEGQKDNPSVEHTCQHVCPTCGKCTDESCTDPKCADKCTCPPAPVAKEITGISLDIPETTEYRLSENLSDIVKYAINYNDGSKDSGNTFVEEDFSDYLFEDGKVKSTASVEIRNKSYSLNVELPVQAAKQVHEVKENAAFKGTVEGLFVAKQLAASRVTIALWDKDANSLMNVNFYDVSFNDLHIAEGDLLRVPVNAGVFDGKLARFSNCIISSGNDITTWDGVTDFATATAVELLSQPENVSYTHKNTLDDVDLFGAKIKVTYSDGSEYVADVTKEMLSGEWCTGECQYTVSYEGLECATKLVVNFIPTGISLDEFMAKEGGVFEVECLVVGAQTVYGHAELLIKDVNSNTSIGVWNTGITGAWNAPVLDETVVKKGDKIIVTLERLVMPSAGADTGKVYANCGSFKTSFVKMGENFPITYDLEDESIVTLTTQDEFKAWVEGDQKFYKIAKLVNPRCVFSGDLMYPFLSPANTAQSYTYGGLKLPLFAPGCNYNTHIGAGTINTWFDTVDGESYLQGIGDLYILYQGGNAYQHVLDILDPSWFVPAELTDIEISSSIQVCLETSSVKTLGIIYRNVYSNNSNGEWVEIPEASFGTQEVKDGKIVCPVTITIGEKTFNKEISLTIVDVDHIEIESQPTATYDQKTKLESLDLTNATIRVHYTGGTSEVIPLTLSMVSGDPIHLGENTLLVSYCEKTCELKINVVSTAMSLTEFVGQANGTYDVECVVVGALTVYGTPELLVKDSSNNTTIGIWNTGICGAWNAPKLNETYVKKGDKIIVSLDRLVMGSAGADTGKVYASCSSFTTSFMIVERNCSIAYNLEDESIVKIDNQEDFKTWVQGEEKFYKIAELVNPRATIGTNAEALVYPFFAPNTAAQKYTYGGSTLPLFAPACNYSPLLGVNTLAGTYFKPVEGTAYYEYTGSVYILFQGGNAYQHVIDILDPSWFVPAEITDIEVDPSVTVCTESSIIKDMGIKYRPVYSNNTNGEWVEIPEAAFGTQEVKDGKIVCSVALTIGEKTFNKEISLTIVEVDHIEIETAPTNSPNQRTTLATFDVTGAQIKVYYVGGESDVVPLTLSMISGEPLKLGENTLLVTYCGKTCELKVTAVNDAISIAEFKQKTNGTYDVECVVVGAQTVYGSTELLVKDQNSNEMIGIWNTGITGVWNGPALNETVVKKGDKIIASLDRLVNSTNGGDSGKIYASSSSFSTSFILLERNVAVTFDLNDESIVEITTQEGFKDWVEGDDRFYKIAKLVNPRATIGTNAEALVYPFFAPNTAAEKYTYGGLTLPLFAPACNYSINLGVNTLAGTYFKAVEGESYYEYNGSVYVLLQGGNAYQHVIDILDPSWFVPAEA